MSGFFGNNSALTVFKIENPAAVTVEKLKQHAFRSIDNSAEAQSLGWCSIEDMLDTQWQSPPEKGQFLFFSLRLDKRKVPAPVLKKHLAEALRGEEVKNRAEGKTYVSRARKKELKELHMERLLSKMDPSPTTVDVALDTQTGLTYLCTTSSALCTLWMEYMILSFGQEPQILLSSMDDIPAIFKRIYEHSQEVCFDGHNYTVAETGQLTLGSGEGENKIEVSVKNEHNSAQNGIDSGLSIKKILLQMTRNDEDSLVWTFVLTPDLCFASLKTPKVNNKDDAEPDSALLEKMYLIGQAVGVVHTLFEVK